VFADALVPPAGDVPGFFIPHHITVRIAHGHSAPGIFARDGSLGSSAKVMGERFSNSESPLTDQGARALDLPASCACEACGNGYRFAKRNGKPFFTNQQKPLRHRRFLDSLPGPFGCTFTSRSSRTLNCPSNFSGHINPNKPANGKRMIRQSVGGLAIRSCALHNKGRAVGRKTGSHFC
jgi:hypothetical protein